MDCINLDEEVESIVEKYIAKFNVTVEKARYDLYVFLNDLRLYGYVSFELSEIENILYDFVNSGITIAGELDYAIIGNLVRKSIKEKRYTYCLKDDFRYYHDILLRNRAFDLTEVFFYKRVENERTTILGINTELKSNMPSTITFIEANTIDDIKKVFDFAICKLKTFGKTKINIFCYEGQITRELLQVFKALGMKEEAKLIKEDGINDRYIYSILL